MMLCILVSIHLNPQPVKHLMARNQPQDRVNHLVWPHTHHGHHHHAGLLLSSMSHHRFSLELPTQMLTQAEHKQVLQNHVAAANVAFNKVAVFESLIQQEPHNASCPTCAKEPAYPCYN